MSYCIYALHAKGVGIFYIGCTSNPEQRLKHHISYSKIAVGHFMYDYIRINGLKIQMSIIEHGIKNKRKAFGIECKWMHILRMHKYKLLNLCHVRYRKKYCIIRNKSFNYTIRVFPDLKTAESLFYKKIKTTQ